MLLQMSLKLTHQPKNSVLYTDIDQSLWSHYTDCCIVK